MISLILGSIILAFSIGGTVMAIQDSSASALFQWHAIELVIGGTLGILLLSNPWRLLLRAFRAVLELVRDERPLSAYNETLLEMAKTRAAPKQIRHPLLDYAAKLWEQGIEPKMFSTALMLRRRDLEKRNSESVMIFKSLSKYPPALGMMGTVISMVAMFQGLQSQKDQVGVRLSIAMTATFIGLLVANAFILPVADRLAARQAAKKKELDALFEILVFINSGEPISFLKEEVKNRAA